MSIGATGSRRHDRPRFARVLAGLALVAHLLVGLAPLWVPAAERGGIEICTVDGLRIVPGSLPVPDGDAGDRIAKACGFCVTNAAPVALPPLVVGAPPAGRTTTITERPAPTAMAASPAGFDHLSRAPPRLS